MTSPELLRLAVGDHALLIDPVRGARAVSWSYAGHELLARHGDDPVEYGMYPMAPWAGRVRGNVVDGPDGPVVLPLSYAEWALHGTALAAPMEVEEATDTRLRASVPTPSWWPWPARVEVTWTIGAHEVTTELAVSSEVAGCPVVLGWHPWFHRQLDAGGPLTWGFDASAQAQRGADHLPTGAYVDVDLQAGPFDDAFVVPSRQAVMEWPEALRLDINSSADWFVVYDELPSFVCFEPQSGPPDGLRHDSVRPVETAGPGRPVRLTTQWRLTALSAASVGSLSAPSNYR